MEKVKNRRKRIYEYIILRLSEGYAPSVREICQDLNIPSTSTVHGDLHALTDEGLIEMDQGRNRTIRLPGPGSLSVPLIGTVTAGVPILAMENIEQYIPVAMLGYKNANDLFALRVRGDSMMNAAILDEDVVIVEKDSFANNGDIVVALVEDEATVKRFFKENGGYRLQPENDRFSPIIVDELEVLGKVVCVYRFYS